MLQINHLSTVWCLCSTGYGTLFIWADWEASGWRAESPFPWHQGADFRWLINRQQAENDWQGAEKTCQMIRELIQGAWTGLWKRASSLAQSVHGGSAQVNEKRLQGAAMLWKRLYKHDETEETRRPARPKYKKFYPVLVSPVNFLNWW